MHTRLVTFASRLIVSFGILLALPGSAIAANFTASGPGAIGETAGTATYDVTCGDNGLPSPLTLPAGVLSVSVTPGPAPPAAAGVDYTVPSVLPFTCSALGAEFSVDIPILNDQVDELGERFTVTVTDTLGLTGAPIVIPTVITDDDPLASIAPVVMLAEGDSGTSAAEVTVTLASTAVQPTTIGFSTEDFSADSGSDYTATSGQVVIPTGQTTGTISVPVVGDTTPEGTEAFLVNLTTTDNGSLDPSQKQAAIGIFDNDTGPVPTLSLPKAVPIKEGDAGTGNVLFAVKLSSPAPKRTEVAWRTANWNADKTDYDSASGKLVFQKGQRSKTISVDVKGDRRDEPDEAFTVELRNPVNALLGAPKFSFGVIEDDDGPKMKIGKPRVRGEHLIAKVGCPESADGCTGKLVGNSGGLKLGRKRFDLEGGEAKKLKLKLSDAAQETLSEERRRAKLKATASDSSGDTRVTTRRATL